MRLARIAISVVAFVVLTLGLTGMVWIVPGLFRWLTTVQLGWAVSAMSLTVFAAWMLVTLVLGRIYCSTVCPMGTLMDVSSRLRLAVDRGHVYRFKPATPLTGYVMLVVVVVGMMCGITLLLTVLDPYEAYSRIIRDFLSPVTGIAVDRLVEVGVLGNTAWRVVNVSVAAAMVGSTIFAFATIIAWQTGRALCNSFCPIGAILGFVSRYSIFQIQIDTDKCTQCRRCEYVCKAHCIDLADHVVDGARCVGCFDCLAACHDDAIHYTTDRKRLSQPLMQKIRSIGKRTATPEPSLDAGKQNTNKLNENIIKSENNETIS